MNKFKLVLGIILDSLGALSLLVSWFFKWVHDNTLDGSASLYESQHKNMIIFLVSGIILVVIGTLILILRKK